MMCARSASSNGNKASTQTRLLFAVYNDFITIQPRYRQREAIYDKERGDGFGREKLGYCYVAERVSEHKAGLTASF
jgi:hypothetical protein